MPIGHSGIISSAAYSPDGKFIITASSDKTAKIWDAACGKIILTLQGHNDRVHSCCFSPDGKYALTASYDNTVKVWDATNGTLLNSIDEHLSFITAAAFSPDGQYVLSACLDCPARLWDTKTGTLIQTLQGPTDEITSAVFSPDGRYVFTTANDSGLIVWKALTAEITGSIADDLAPITHASYSPDGRNILTTHNDGSIKIRSASDGTLRFCLGGFQKGLLSGAYSHDGKEILTVGVDRSVSIWDAATGQFLRQFTVNADTIKMASYSPDGTQLMIVCGDNSIRFLDVVSGIQLSRIYVGSNEINTAICSPLGNTLLTITRHDTVTTWNIRTGKRVYELAGHTAYEYLAVFSNNGRWILTSSSENIMHLWDTKTWRAPRFLKGHQDEISYAAFSRDDNYLLTADYSNTVKMWDITSGELLHNFENQNEFYCAFSVFSPDSTSFLTVGTDNAINLWDITSGKLLQCFKGHQDIVSSATFSPDGKFILSASYDHTLKIWDTKTGKPLHTLEGHLGKVYAATFSNDGKMVVSASYDKSSRVWNAGTGKIIHTLLDSDAMFSAVFTPDGGHIITISRNNTVKIWDARSGQVQSNLDWDATGLITTDISPDGKTLLTTSRENRATLWEISTGRLLKTIDLGKCTFFSVNWGDSIILAHFNSSLVAYDLNTGKEIISFMSIDENEFLILSPENDYFCSKGSANKLSWRIGMKLYGFDQFDLQYNRPDKVLKRMNLADTSMIQAYREAYNKRLRKMNFDEKNFSPEFHLPETEILFVDKLPMITNSQPSVITVNAIDTKYKLDRLNIWINDVPVYGITGIDLRALKTGSFKNEITLNLSQGENKIQVSCLNEKGVESLKESVWITYEPMVPVVSRRYLCAISVSKYKQTQFNLKYAVKDGRDMSQLFAGRNTIIDTLFNQNATRENILALKEKLMQTREDDEVILYVSGHGLLDENYEFYFATYDMNFSNPAERGILYDNLEGLLDGIPARKKLLLMDACHSGELDKEDITLVDTNARPVIGGKGDVKTYGYKGTEVDATIGNSKLGLQNSFELMQELFANLTRGSGAVVISAAAGTGYALESPEWNNGVFTYCVLNGLKNLAADANGDKSVTVTELKDYVSKEVERLTNGAQKPTSRRESLEFDWSVW